MPFEHYIHNGTKKLRCGYTTGSCAAIATKAAAKMLLTKSFVYKETIETPKGIAILTDILDTEINNNFVSCAVMKDAGDDCDVTDKMLIYSKVSLRNDTEINIDGGIGIGRVTKAGLDQPIGNAAINSTPRKMIISELKALCEKYDYNGGFDVIISAPDGVEAAKKTFNSGLGIEGGISILGTSGIVEPQSLQALIDTIHTEMNMLSKNGVKDLILVPGNYGEGFLSESDIFKDIDIKQVKISNFFGEAIDFSAELEYKNILFVSHIGKAVKLAGGIMNTHSRYADCRKEIFTAYASLCGADRETVLSLMESISTDACIEILKQKNLDKQVLNEIINSAEEHIKKRSGEKVNTGIIMFSNVYGCLGISKNAESILKEWRTK